MGADRTPAERRAEARALLRDVRRMLREPKLRAGKVAPRTYREAELFAADLLGKDVPPGDQKRPR